MKCSTCQFENPDRAKYCKKCGNKLERLCPSYGRSFQSDGVFCDECGYNFAIPSEPSLKELSFDEKLTKIQRYLTGPVWVGTLGNDLRVEFKAVGDTVNGHCFAG